MAKTAQASTAFPFQFLFLLVVADVIQRQPHEHRDQQNAGKRDFIRQRHGRNLSAARRNRASTRSRPSTSSM